MINPLGSMLRITREDCGLGLRQLARTLDVSPAHVSRIETGDYTPGPELLARWCRVLKVDSDEAHRLAGLIPDDVRAWLLKPGNLSRVRRMMGREGRK